MFGISQRDDEHSHVETGKQTRLLFLLPPITLVCKCKGPSDILHFKARSSLTKSKP